MEGLNLSGWCFLENHPCSMDLYCDGVKLIKDKHNSPCHLARKWVLNEAWMETTLDNTREWAYHIQSSKNKNDMGLKPGGEARIRRRNNPWVCYPKRIH